MFNKVKELWQKTDDVLLRYPMVLVMALIAAISAVTSIELEHETQQFTVIKILITACLGISFMFGIKMLSQRIGKNIILEIVGVIFLVAFYFILPEKESDFTEKYAFILIPSFLLSHLLVSFIAYYPKNNTPEFWQYNKTLFINVVITAIFTVVLVLGVVLAILAVDKLFDLDFDEILYPKTLSFLGIFGSAFIFMIFNDKGLPDLEKFDDYPIILKFFTQFVLIPLLFIYAIILYLYSIKILINWELPRGWVSYLILAYSIVGILALLLVHPLKDDKAKSWVKIFSRIFYFTLIPLLILLFVAIFTRILEYGYTEPRYFVLLLAIWLATVCLYFIFWKKQTIKFIPVSLFIFGLFALLFPYFNTFSVAKRSQKNELHKLLMQNNLLSNGKINFNLKISSEIVNEISNKFNFLHLRFDQEALEEYLSKAELEQLNKMNKNATYRNINGSIASLFKNVQNPTHKIYRIEIYTDNKSMNVEGFQQLITLNNAQKTVFNINNDEITIENKLQNHKQNFKVILNNEIEYDIIPFLKKKMASYQIGSDRILVDDISTDFTIGHYDMRLIFDQISQQPTEYFEYNYGQGYLLVKQNKQ